MEMLWRQPKLEWTDEHERTLRALNVDEGSTGTVLRDFQNLLSFVRERKLPASKAHRLPPLKVLPEINARLTQPIALGLKRPQLKSYPHIQGLYLLLRASGLCRVGGTSSKPVLTIDEATYHSWSGLNLTERYFTLIETWLLRGNPEIVGERGSMSHFIGSSFLESSAVIDSAQGDGLPIAGNDSAQWYFRHAPGPYGIALLELFGFLSVEQGPPQEGQGWQVERVFSTPLGLAVMALLGEEVFKDFATVLELEQVSAETFGTFQPVFQSYIPAWRNNLSVPAWQVRKGMHVFKVSLGRDLWRRIAIPGALTLDTLAETIIGAFEFTYDHLYQFTYRNRFGVETHVNHPYLDEGPWTSEVRVGEVPLLEGQLMTYLYDFGDQWEFDVTLERVDPVEPAIKDALVVDAHGEAPEQYPSWE
jgi:hypothetical protein